MVDDGQGVVVGKNRMWGVTHTAPVVSKNILDCAAMNE